jgi:hypothetical protein
MAYMTIMQANDGCDDSIEGGNEAFWVERSTQTPAWMDPNMLTRFVTSIILISYLEPPRAVGICPDCTWSMLTNAGTSRRFLPAGPH